MEDANIKAEKAIGDLKAQEDEEKAKLEKLKQDISDFKARILDMYREHLTQVSLLPEEEPAAEEPAEAPTEEPAADVAEIADEVAPVEEAAADEPETLPAEEPAEVAVAAEEPIEAPAADEEPVAEEEAPVSCGAPPCE